jgi:hypothetical protein
MPARRGLSTTDSAPLPGNAGRTANREVTQRSCLSNCRSTVHNRPCGVRQMLAGPRGLCYAPAPLMQYVALVALLAGAAIGAVRGGSLSRLLELTVRHAWLIPLAFLVQVAMFVTPLERWLGDLVAPALMASNAALLALVVVNVRLPGMMLFGIGLAANTLVMLLNGGYMPVSPAALVVAGLSERIEVLERLGHSDKSQLMTSETRLPFLGDVLPVAPVNKVLSVGDLAIGAGITWLVAAQMGRRNPAGVPVTTHTP